jgi:hypothetical protein
LFARDEDKVDKYRNVFTKLVSNDNKAVKLLEYKCCNISPDYVVSGLVPGKKEGLPEGKVHSKHTWDFKESEKKFELYR